jgi:hypothetical protein
MSDSENQSNDQNFQLPASLAQPVDLNRMIRDLELISEHLGQEALKDPNKKIPVNLPDKIKDISEKYHIDVSDKKQRENLLAWMKHLREIAPVVNVSFGSEASDQVTQKVTAWFRQEIHPYCLVVVGLEPDIGVGSMVRTSNRVFDFSLKTKIKNSTDLFEQAINEVRARDKKPSQEASAASEPAAAAQQPAEVKAPAPAPLAEEAKV